MTKLTSPIIALRIEQELLDKIDQRKRAGRAVSRSDAIRTLLRTAIAQEAQEEAA